MGKTFVHTFPQNSVIQELLGRLTPRSCERHMETEQQKTQSVRMNISHEEMRDLEKSIADCIIDSPGFNMHSVKWLPFMYLQHVLN